jgi:outer membrane protein OmpA-like peptidoglycan-associated protein
MSYVSVHGFSGPAGGCSCGPHCSCSGCRVRPRTLGEIYVRESEEPRAPPARVGAWGLGNCAAGPFGWIGAPERAQELQPGPLVICSGKSFAVLDQFHFDKSALRRDAGKDHFAQVDAIAREVVLRWTAAKPVGSICLQGHTDFIGKDPYNVDLGERRARAVKDELCKALVHHALLARRPDIPGKMTIAVTSMGESDPVAPGSSPAARARNRRVAVYLLTEQVPGERCAVPESRSKRCNEMDVLTEHICENSQRICKLAAELGDAQSRAKCEESRRSCAAARERSVRCR